MRAGGLGPANDFGARVSERGVGYDFQSPRALQVP